MTEKELKVLGKKKAQNTIDFISSLRHTIGKFNGTYFEPFDWQEKILRDVYGTLKPDGNRQYKTIYIELPKKQGKSELLAAIGIKQLCADEEWAAEVYGCAADKAQARIIYNVAKVMIEQEPELAARCKIIDSVHRIVYRPTNSFYQVLSAEAFTKHGLNVSCCLFDELHAQPNRALYDVMTFGSGDAREQPLHWFITTAGDDPDRSSICWEMHEKAEAILLGTRIDPTFYPVIFGVDEENKRAWHGWGYKKFKKIDWKDEKIWALVNPSLDKTVKMDTLREAKVSVQGNAADEKLFKQLRLNIWVKYKSTKWVPFDTWMLNTGIVDRQRLKGRECYGGLDVASKLDMTAYVNIFPPIDGGGKFEILPTFWMPEDNIDEFVSRYNLPYRQWADQGLLRTTPGNKIDYHYIVNDIHEQSEEFKILEIGYDPFMADMIETDMTEAGLTMVQIRQTFQGMSQSMKELEAYLHGKHINHGNNPILNWMFGNVEVITNSNGDVKPTKGIRRGNSKAVTGTSYYKIDGIVAMINAMARVIVHKNESKNPYERRGMLSLLDD